MAAPQAYFDTSALLKRYVKEQGSETARVLLRRFRVLSSAVVTVEIMSALGRRRAAGDLSEQALAAILSRLQDDRSRWRLVEVGQPVLGRAEEIVSTTSLRTLDAIHVASALVFRGGTGLQVPFVTADSRQRDAASVLGLAVTWVE
jgi:predicted nucleic acid-binding protein